MNFVAAVLLLAASAEAFSVDRPSFVSRNTALRSSYLDQLAPAPSTTMSGPGIGSYLDSVSSQAAPSTMGGPGIGGYLESMGGGAEVAAPPAPPAPVAVPPPAAVAPPAPAAPAAVAVSSAGGSGIGGYLDSIPTNSDIMGGAGIQSYTAMVPTGSALSGGAGIQSYTSMVPTGSNLAGGAGLSTYLDTVAPQGPPAAVAPFQPAGASSSTANALKVDVNVHITVESN